MKPYTALNHLLSDLITQELNQEIEFCWFKNVRYQPSEKDYVFEQVEYREDYTIYGEGFQNWLNSIGNEIDYCYTNKWNRYPYKQRLLQVIDHSYEPVYCDVDQKLWDPILNGRDPSCFVPKSNTGRRQPTSTVLVLHSEKNSKDIIKLKKWGYKTAYWFSHAYLCSEFYFRIYRNLKIVTDYKSRPIKYKWLCPNRLIDGPRKYRLEFLNLLDYKKGVYSLLDKDPYTNRNLIEILPNNKVKPNSFDTHDNASAEIHVTDLTPWNTSFLHIVNETVWQYKIHFTEKIFKPIVLHQPFVVLQAPCSLLYLKEYGFKTFDNWWDEGYDTIQDPIERMNAIADIVNWIGNKSLEELETMRSEMASVLEHNFHHFYENIPAICLEELKTNLTQ